MIRLFNRSETNFSHNKTILTPLSCYVIEEANGMYELEMELPKSTEITSGDVIKAPTPRGDQLFRIYRSVKSLKGKKVYAKHIFYDLSKNFLIDVRPTDKSCMLALNDVLNAAEYAHNFTGLSDIESINTAYYIRQNPIQAIIGSDNSILNIWGGNLIRDNFSIHIKANGIDRGYEIRMGKNLIGIEDDSDESNVKTRIYPTVVLGDDDQVYSLPEKYVDSPLINNYGNPIIYEERIDLTDEQKLLSLNELYNIMRNYCNNLFETDNIDKPVINYKVDFVELSKTEQYKDLAILEQLDLYDIVTVNVSHLDINVKARVIKYKYDCLKEHYETIELGDFSSISSYKTDSIVKQLQSSIKASQSAAEYATNVITGNKGGYVVIRRYPDGKPYEILIMDTGDINTAVNVLRINNSGLGFSRNGYNGEYGTAMTIDGHIVADFVDSGVLRGLLIQGGAIQIGTLSSGIYPFMVDSTGKLIASNAIIKGLIEATSGKIANFNITSEGLKSNTVEILDNVDEPIIWINSADGLQHANYQANAAFVSTQDSSGVIHEVHIDARENYRDISVDGYHKDGYNNVTDYRTTYRRDGITVESGTDYENSIDITSAFIITACGANIMMINGALQMQATSNFSVSANGGLTSINFSDGAVIITGNAGVFANGVNITEQLETLQSTVAALNATVVQQASSIATLRNEVDYLLNTN